MSLLRRSEVVDLKSKLVGQDRARITKNPKLPILVGEAIVKRHLPHSFRPHRSQIEHLLPVNKNYLKAARLQLVHQLIRKPRLRAKRAGYLERHMGADGTMFPPRPSFMHRIERPDPAKQHWTVQWPPRVEVKPDGYHGKTHTAKSARNWVKGGAWKKAPRNLWKVNMGQRLVGRGTSLHWDKGEVSDEVSRFMDLAEGQRRLMRRTRSRERNKWEDMPP